MWADDESFAGAEITELTPEVLKAIEQVKTLSNLDIKDISLYYGLWILMCMVRKLMGGLIIYIF